jgi:methionine-rich copper-binding protein CopC
MPHSVTSAAPVRGLVFAFPCRPRTLVLAALFGLVGALGFASPSFAHAHLKRAEPAADSTVPASPPSLSLSFTEAVEPRFSTVEVQGPDGKKVQIGGLEARDNGLTLVGSLPALQPGTYTVVWHATSVDTHKTEGKFTFTVGR